MAGTTFSAVSTVLDLFMENCDWDNSQTTGIKLDCSNGGQIRNVLGSNFRASYGSGPGVSIVAPLTTGGTGYVKGIAFSNFEASKNTHEGIAIYGLPAYCSGISFINPQVNGNSSLGPGYNNILIAGGDGILIQGGAAGIYQTEVGTNSLYGVAIQSTFTGVLSILGTDLRGNQNGPFLNSSSSPINAPFVLNRIINGAMQIAQRGINFSSPSGYTVDQWIVGYSGSPVASVAQVTGPTGFPYALQMTGAPGNTEAYILQRIESANIADLAGTTVTLSATIQASSNQTVRWVAAYPTAKDNWASQVFIAGGTFSVTTTAQTFSAQITLPSQVANGLAIGLEANNDGPFTSGTLTITGVQLVAGVFVAPFDQRQIETELTLCQRYYAVINMNAQSPTTGNLIVPWYGTVAMRTTPTVSLISGGSASNASINGAIPFTNQPAGYFQIVSSAAGGFVTNALYSVSAEL